MKKIELKVASLNIQGSLNTKCKNDDFIDIVKNYDLLCIQESWLIKGQSSDIKNYEYFRSDRYKGKTSKRGHGGVVIYFKKELKHGLTKLKSKNPDNIWVKLNKNFFNFDKDIFLLCSYIPPHDSKIHKGYDVYNNLNIEITSFSHRGDILIFGDLNSRISNQVESYVTDVVDNNSINVTNENIRFSNDDKVNSQGKKLMEIVNSNYMTIVNGRTLGDLDGQYTCYKYNGCSVVDYCIVSNSFYKNINYFQVLELEYFSDHCPITCSIKCNVSLEKDNTFKGKKCSKYKWNDIEREKFCTVLKSEQTINEVKLLNQNMSEHTENAAKAFQDFVIKIADKALRKSKNNRKKSKFKFTEECQSLKTEFKRAQRKFKMSPDKNDCNNRLNMLIAQKKYRRAINMQKRLKKENNINALKKIEKSDPKLFWKSIKNLINDTSQNKIESISDQQWVDYFHNLYNKPNDSSQFGDYIAESLKHIEKQPSLINQNYILLNGRITTDEIISCIKSSKTGKSAGIDMITNEMLKCGIETHTLTEPIQKLFNILLDSGSYPDQWNCSLITPIHKAGPIDDPQNYRGIAVSNCISKVYNKILTKRLDIYMDSNNLWSKFQGGFKEKLRTEDNIMILKTIITEMTEVKNGCLFACFVDFSKFFDTINRNMMFYKMLKLGITGNIYKTIKQMYANCNYAIRINQMISKTFISDTGVKQGCTLSPLLSNLYQNDLHNIFDDTCFPIKLGNLNISSLSWADDLILLSTSSDGLQNCLNKLSEYCNKWNLTINSDKTKYMVFGKSKAIDLKYRNISIDRVKQYKYLGVIIDDNGKTKYAIDERIQKASRAINMLQGALSTTANVSVDIALSLFDKQIFPILTYGSIYWGMNKTYNKLYINNVPNTIKSIKQLTNFFKVQEHCIKKTRHIKCNNNTKPNCYRLLITTDNYNSKIHFLNDRNIETTNIENSYDDHPCEKIHTKFLKYALGINKFASNHAIRAELGRFPLDIKMNLKLVKYWLRMENLNYNIYPILAEAFAVSKSSGHSWYNEILNFLQSIGMGFITMNPTLLSENEILKEITTKCESQYIQSWDSKANENSKLTFLFKIKQNKYKKSNYLNDILNINDRQMLTKLRIGCTKLQSHKFLGKNETTTCPMCNLHEDTVEHLLFNCTNSQLVELRNSNSTKLLKIYPSFSSLNAESKLYTILNLTPFSDLQGSIQEFQANCITFMREMLGYRFNQ